MIWEVKKFIKISNLNYYQNLIEELNQTVNEKGIEYIIFYSPSLDEIK